MQSPNAETSFQPGQNNGGSNNCNNSSAGNIKANNNGSAIPPNGSSASISNGSNSNTSVGLIGGGTSAAAAKNQLEQLNTMREALFSQDGWGCQHVNQDTNWEMPSSPEPTNKDPVGGPSMWKPTINNGTDLWELNLRNGGQPPTPVQKTPWGHTPSSNLGGTWGEDDDAADGSVWTGSSNNPSSGSVVCTSGVPSSTSVNGSGSGPQWGQPSVGVGTTGNGSGAPSVNMGSVSAVGAAVGGSAVTVPGSGNLATANSSVGNNWGEARDINNSTGTTAIAMRGVDPRDPIRGTSAAETRDMRLLDPRDPIRGDPRGISGRLNGTSEMWGHHHSISHNQMPTMNKIVGPSSGMPTSAVVTTGVTGIGSTGINTINPTAVGGNVNSHWGASSVVIGSKDISSIVGKVSGWEEPSPPPQRRNLPGYDDGTSLWGQQTRVPGGSGAHWKDISDPVNRHLPRNIVGNQNSTNPVAGGGTGLGNQVMLSTPSGGGNANNSLSNAGLQGRVGSGAGPALGIGQHKPDNTMWVHANNPAVNARSSASWADETNHNVGPNSGVSWMDDKSNTSIGQLGVSIGNSNSWSDPSVSWNKSQTKLPGISSAWGVSGANDGTDISSEWSNHCGIVGKAHQKVNVNMNNMNVDMIKQSKQYRVLVENGFKKEEVERALINTNMNIEEAADLLRANAIPIDWRRHEETLGSYVDHTNTSGNFPGRYPPTGNQANIPFPPNIINNMSVNTVSASSTNSNLSTVNPIQTLPAAKFLNPVQHSASSGAQSMNPAVAFGQGVANITTASSTASNSSTQPSAQQLRVLVQQIQLAVHSGYLSSQILSEPLPSSMLVLLYQLLTNIKHLQAAQQSLTRGGNNSNNSQISYAIAKYKQQIQNLQNQINAQQAFILKQKQQSMPQNTQHSATHTNNSNLDYMRGQHDSVSALQSNFSDINLSKPGGYPVGPNSQSKLINQWKLPEKETTADSTEFSRAPGTTKQNISNPSVMGPLGFQNDGTWSTGRGIGDGWPDTSSESENKDWAVAQHTPTATYTDLVQEFEPGKPWKGSQLKNIEDDPTITPGSVARSPLSMNSTSKDADIFSNPSKSSPTDLTPLSLSSSTWSFNPSSSNQNFQSWSDSAQQCVPSELWASSINKTSRGPPPGLGASKSVGISATGTASAANSTSVVVGGSNGWIASGGRGGVSNSSGWNTANSGWSSTWLLLKNLTAQIDASTLRTLCMQHGPLVNFHLYLNQGIALCKYATREEANKAQMTLNNCVLGSTTICAESPSENEVQSILQHFPQPSNATIGNGGNNSKNSVSGGSCVISSNSGNNNAISGTNISVSGGNAGISNHSALGGNSGNNSCGTNILSSATSGSNGNGAGSHSQTSSGSCSSSGVKNGNSNNIIGGNGGTSTSSSTTIGSNNSVVASTWRQNQNQLNQSRPSGRDEYDYISKFVCSIVDD